MQQHQKSVIMLLAMIVGAIFRNQLTVLDSITQGMITPVLLFAMLFITFCCIDLRELRFSVAHLWLLLFQMVGSVGVYYLLLPFGAVTAQGVMLCVVTPIATAAVVMGGMLGADIKSIASYSLLCNLAMSLFTPIFFTHIGANGCSFMAILLRVFPLMVIPPLLAQIMRSISLSATEWFANRRSLSYYFWVVSLTITIGKTTKFLLENIETIDILGATVMLLGSLVICIAQYRIGRAIGSHHNDAAAAEQSLGQKNTILAIWLSQTMLTPTSSLAPAAYVIWQNIMNSYKLYCYNNTHKK